MCFDFDENGGSSTTNYNDAGAPETCALKRGSRGTSESFAPPFRSTKGSSLLGSTSRAALYNRVDTELYGPLAGHSATIRFCAKERHADDDNLSYLFGIRDLRLFTGDIGLLPSHRSY